MANQLLDRAWAVPADALENPAIDKPILANLCDRANADGGGIYMSASSLAVEVCQHRVTVANALKRLRDRGFIRAVGTRRKGVIEYAINIPALKWERWKKFQTESSPKSVDSQAPVADDYTCSPPLQAAVADDYRHLLPTATQTVIEPLVEPCVPAGADAPVRAAIEKVLTGYTALYAEHRNGARFVLNRKRHVPNVRKLLESFDVDRVLKLASELLVLPPGTDKFIDATDRGIEILVTKATWLDTRLREQEAVIETRVREEANHRATIEAREAQREQIDAAQRTWRSADGESLEELKGRVGFMKAMGIWAANAGRPSIEAEADEMAVEIAS